MLFYRRVTPYDAGVFGVGGERFDMVDFDIVGEAGVVVFVFHLDEDHAGHPGEPHVEPLRDRKREGRVRVLKQALDRLHLRAAVTTTLSA